MEQAVNIVLSFDWRIYRSKGTLKLKLDHPKNIQNSDVYIPWWRMNEKVIVELLLSRSVRNNRSSLYSYPRPARLKRGSPEHKAYQISRVREGLHPKECDVDYLP